jgi:NAD(P)-dependent dehydrogenase (short-subunit alcohol dehydrogenase family)
MDRYAGKVVLITGAGAGIGRATALRLAKEGAAVAILDLRAEAAEAVAVEIGARALPIAGSVADPADIDRALAAAEGELGPLDLLVNNAAFAIKPTFESCGPEDWDREFEITLKGAYRCCRAVLPGMLARGHGAIVNVGSVNGLMYFGNPAYSAAKAGLLSLTRTLAVEAGSRGVRVNHVSPGTIRTNSPTWTIRQQRDPAIFEKLARWYPVGRVGTPDDIAAAIAFLGADEAAFVNGANLVVDGGLTAGMGVMIEELTLERDAT